MEIVTPSPEPEILLHVKSFQLEDRAVLDKALRAFVSHIQAYAKHECNVILRLKGKIQFCLRYHNGKQMPNLQAFILSLMLFTVHYLQERDLLT